MRCLQVTGAGGAGGTAADGCAPSTSILEFLLAGFAACIPKDLRADRVGDSAPAQSGRMVS